MYRKCFGCAKCADFELHVENCLNSEALLYGCSANCWSFSDETAAGITGWPEYKSLRLQGKIQLED